MIYIVIPVFNRWIFTKACLQSLQKQTYQEFKIVVVDHGSSDGTQQNMAKEFPEIITLHGDESMWWTAATNLGVKYAISHDAKYVLTLNNDLIVEENYLETLHLIAEKHPKSIIGSISVDIENSEKVFFNGFKWNALTAKYIPSIPLNVPYSKVLQNYLVVNSDLLPGRGTLIPTKLFKSMGLFDEQSFPHYMADEDFALSSKKFGYSCLVSVKSPTYSHILATGLNKIYRKKDYKYWKDFFTSIRSPNNVTYRWRWAKKHAKIPIAYLVLDYGRIIASQIVKSYK